MKKFTLIILTLLLLMVSLTAANPWKARLTIINQTKEPIYISMEYPYTWLRVPYIEIIDVTKKPRTVFTIERGVYQDVEIYACGAIAKGTMDLTRNLRLNFTDCDQMLRSDKPQYLGEPSMEKPNWFREPGMAGWRFVFSTPVEQAPVSEPENSE